jgi:hypothetical protein
MKICLILLLFIFNSINTKAQEKENDTISLIKEIRLNKEKYIGKPFAVLLDDLKIKPNKIFHSSPANNRNVVYMTSLYFRSDLNNFYITIVWQDYIPKTEINERNNYRQLNKSEIDAKYSFTKEKKNYVKNKIIKDIITHY